MQQNVWMAHCLGVIRRRVRSKGRVAFYPIRPWRRVGETCLNAFAGAGDAPILRCEGIAYHVADVRQPVISTEAVGDSGRATGEARTGLRGSERTLRGALPIAPITWPVARANAQGVQAFAGDDLDHNSFASRQIRVVPAKSLQTL